MINRTMPDTTKKGWEQQADFFWPPSQAQVCVSSNRWIQHNAEQTTVRELSGSEIYSINSMSIGLRIQWRKRQGYGRN